MPLFRIHWVEGTGVSLALILVLAIKTWRCKHLSLSLSLPLPTVTLRAARRGIIKYYFTAAPWADEERLFCLFQIKTFLLTEKVWIKQKCTHLAWADFSIFYIKLMIIRLTRKTNDYWFFQVLKFSSFFNNELIEKCGKNNFKPF